MALKDPAFKSYALWTHFWRPDWERYKQIFRVGVPLGLNAMIEMGFFSVCTFLVGIYEPGVLAAHAIALQITGLAYMAAFGLSQASTMRVGYATGARQAEKMKRSGNTALSLCVVVTALLCVLLLLFGEQAISIFAEDGAVTSDAFIKAGAGLLAIAAFVLAFDGARAVLHGNLAGLTDTRIPMIYQAIGFLGRRLHQCLDCLQYFQSRC